jgi:predicted permease
MPGLVIRTLIRLAARLVPRADRPRWREEWLAELGARPSVGRGLGALPDAARLRFEALASAVRDLAAGWRADAIQAVRGAAHAPVHAVGVVACLAIGMAVSIGVFSLLNALLYGDLIGVADRQTLARFFVSHDDAAGAENLGRGPGMVRATALSVSDFDVLARAPVPGISSYAGEGSARIGVSLDARVSGATAVFVSADYFRTLRTPAHAGRLLTAADDRPDADPVAVIGYHLWRDRFDARPDIIGRTLLAGGSTVTVVGIAPPRFTGIQPPDPGASPLDHPQLWLPLSLAARWPGVPDRDASWLTVVGRLSDGASQDVVRAQVAPAAAGLAADRPDIRRGAMFLVRSHGFGPGDSPVQVLAILVLFMSVPISVLAIACANVANLQIARATRRSREIAVRLALGASRLQVVRLLTVETLVLVLVAAIVGFGGARLMLVWFESFMPMVVEIDARVVAFILAISAGSTLAAGLAPAWLASRRQATADGLRQTAQAGGVGHSRVRSALIVGQIAVSLALLTMCGLFTRSSIVVAQGVPPALGEIVRADLDVRGFNGTRSDATRLQREVVERLSADPRVAAVAIEDPVTHRYRADPSTDVDWYLDGAAVTPGWLDAAGARLQRGRWFTRDDRADVAVVNARLAGEIAADGNAIGRQIQVRQGDSAPRAVTIVGIVEPMPNSPMDDNRKLYVPVVEASPAGVLVVRGGDVPALETAIRQTVASVEPRLPWVPTARADQAYLRGADPVTYLAMSMAAFGGIALVLAATGLFAMVAYVVSLRLRELGIRAALGARGADLVRLVLRQATRLALWGVAVGLAIIAPLAIALRAVFLGISPVDPVAIGAPMALLLAVAVLAALIPARRASAVDPVSVLRDL